MSDQREPITGHLEGRDLRRLREDAGLRLRDAALALSVSMLRLTQMEAGTVPVPCGLRARAEVVYGGGEV